MEEGSDHDNAPLNSRIFGSIPEHFSNIKVPVFTKDVDTIIQSVLADKEYMERMIAEQDPELDRLNAEHEELKAVF